MEGDFAWDVDIKQMHFAVRFEEFPLGREDEGCVVVFFAFCFELGDAAADEIGFCFCGELGEGVEGFGLLGGGRGGEKGFGVFGEVLGPVGGVETFRQDDDFGAGGGGFEDFRARGGEVGGFGGAGGELD